jgi:hypothetical protein
MSAAQSAIRLTARSTESRATTLLELVTAITSVTDDDREVVATVLHLLRSGRVHLCGNFRGRPVEDFA